MNEGCKLEVPCSRRNSMVSANPEVRYNVVCRNCAGVWTPAVRSSLWWRAKKAADSGRLDAIHVSGEECGCIEKKTVVQPDAPYRVFGYDGDCRDYDIPCTTLVKAIAVFKKCAASGDVVFIQGVSHALEDRLKYGW